MSNQYECLSENTEKYITFSIPMVKEFGDGNSVIYKIALGLCQPHYLILGIAYQMVCMILNVTIVTHVLIT